MTPKEFWHVSDIDNVRSDNEFRKVVDWLVRHGAPRPTIRKALYPGNLETTECVFAEGVFRATADVVASPSTVLTELQKEKVAAGDPNVYVPYPDVVPENPVKLPPPVDPGPPRVGEKDSVTGYYGCLGGTPQPGQIVEDARGKFVAIVTYQDAFGKHFHYEPLEDESSSPKPQAPIASRVPDATMIPATRDLGAILAELSLYLKPEVFAAVVALIAPQQPKVNEVPPSVEFVDANGNPFPDVHGKPFPSNLVHHKVARTGKTHITAPVGSQLARITYRNGAPLMAAPIGTGINVDSSGSVTFPSVEMNFPDNGVTREGIRWFYGPPSGTDWKPINDTPFEVDIYNFDQFSPIVTGTPRT